MKWDGVFTIVTTPFDATGTVDLGAHREIVEFLVSGGATTLVLFGSEGEGYALTEGERVSLMAATTAAAQGRVTVVAGVSSPSPDEALRLAQHARDAGCDAVMTTAPYYVKYREAGLIAYLKSIEQAQMPTVFYNNPSRTGYAASADQIVRLARQFSLVAVKQAADINELIELIDKSADLETSVVGGNESTFLPALAVGARGNTATGATALPEVFRTLYTAASEGDWQRARDVFARLAPLREAYRQAGGQAAVVKRLLELRGLPGGGNVRVPLEEAPASLTSTLRTLLSSLEVA